MSNGPDNTMRDFARQLFAERDDDRLRITFTGTAERPDTDDPMRAFVRDLFNTDND